MKFLLIAGIANSLINFRKPLIEALLNKGLTVHVAAPELTTNAEVMAELNKLGVIAHDISMQRAGMNPIADLGAVLALWQLMRQIKPQLVLGYTIKPVIYGTLAAWLARVPKRFALITGLGFAFMGEEDGQRSKVRALVQGLYRTALKRSHTVFFQNPDDEALFRQLNILSSATQSCVVNGSGVDIAFYSVAPLPSSISFLLVARLLGDKGIREYINSARAIRELHPEVVFRLVGAVDLNPDSICKSELDSWVEEGVISYYGQLSDVRPAIAESSVFVLPSYREGTPRSVLEAMSMGRAIITTDAPGCRETVIDGENGLLVPVRSVNGLVEAMKAFIANPELAAQMGQRSREIAEERYDVHKVNAVMLREMGITQ